ncbi:hypothetical protein [Paenibacillus sp. DMB5]|uniref:hypothetical protein n=1 Tax=Paenibacillus sp. DMB5 TaxID=1780103 RepID=UPI00076CF4FC|nr:hypothetical protein [Paenibacillus sp. DMB5]KUP25285.1 hypothetical protein AWJ19_18135 [Paenibacillus sp. DMB5]
MKKSIVKVTAAVLLLSQLLSMGGGVQNSRVTAAAAAPSSAKPAATVMTDNLFKYGLKKDVELPVTLTAGGLSYTLEKIMIFDFKSKEAVALRKTYKYGEESGLVTDPKYMVWTKFTVKNNSNVVLNTSNSGEKWSLKFQNLKSLDPVYRPAPVKLNDKSAVSWIRLNPGEQLSSYQAYYYKANFNYFRINLFFNGAFAEKYIVEEI